MTSAKPVTCPKGHTQQLVLISRSVSFKQISPGQQDGYGRYVVAPQEAPDMVSETYTCLDCGAQFEHAYPYDGGLLEWS